MTNLDSILKSRDITLPTKVHLVLDSILKSRDITVPTKVRLLKAMVFPVVMYGCDHEAHVMSFPGGSEVKVSAWNAGDSGLIPGSGRSPGEGNGTPLQYSCLENPMEGGAL